MKIGQGHWNWSECVDLNRVYHAEFQTDPLKHQRKFQHILRFLQIQKYQLSPLNIYTAQVIQTSSLSSWSRPYK